MHAERGWIVGLFNSCISGIPIRFVPEVSLKKYFRFCFLSIEERPAIDRLLDYIWNQEAKKPAIDKLIQEYLERIGTPLSDQYLSSQITPLMSIFPC